jgi:hypothetical protein
MTTMMMMIMMIMMMIGYCDCDSNDQEDEEGNEQENLGNWSEKRKGKQKEMEGGEDKGEDLENVEVQRERGLADVRPGWYQGPGVQDYLVPANLLTQINDPKLKIMKFILGQGECEKSN